MYIIFSPVFPKGSTNNPPGILKSRNHRNQLLVKTVTLNSLAKPNPARVPDKDVLLTNCTNEMIENENKFTVWTTAILTRIHKWYLISSPCTPIPRQVKHSVIWPLGEERQLTAGLRGSSVAAQPQYTANVNALELGRASQTLCPLHNDCCGNMRLRWLPWQSRRPLAANLQQQRCHKSTDTFW